MQASGRHWQLPDLGYAPSKSGVLQGCHCPCRFNGNAKNVTADGAQTPMRSGWLFEFAAHAAISQMLQNLPARLLAGLRTTKRRKLLQMQQKHLRCLTATLAPRSVRDKAPTLALNASETIHAISTEPD